MRNVFPHERPLCRAAVLFTTVALTVSQAAAQESGSQRPGASERSGAMVDGQGVETLLRDGVARREAGDLEGAMELLTSAGQVSDDPRIGYNLALTLFEAGRLTEAQRVLRELIDSDRGVLITDAAEELRARIAARLATLDLTVTGTCAGCRVSIDDRDEGPLGTAGQRRFTVDPGPHRLELLRGSEAITAREITLREGETAAVLLAFDAADIVADTPSAAPARDGRDEDLWLWLGLGGGAAALVVGAIVVGVVVGTQSGPSPQGGYLGPEIVVGTP